MSTLEKFGILVILILVVIIGVVAVWGVGGEKDGANPFAGEPGTDVAAQVDPNAPAAPVEPGTDVPGWTAGGVPTGGAAPVPPPAIGGAPTVPGAAPVAAAPATASTWTVKKGDTGASIATATLGSAGKWKLISDCNNKKDARKLKIGEVLNIPSAGGTSVANTGGVKLPAPSKSIINTNDLSKQSVPAKPVNRADGPTDVHEAPAAPPVDAGGREVEVRSGDTLYEIARRELGDPNLYYKILKANPGLDPKKIRPGMKIKLPSL